MTQTQFTHEPEANLPRLDEVNAAETADEVNTRETEDLSDMGTQAGTEEVSADQSVAVEKLVATLEQDTRRRKKLNSIITAAYLAFMIMFFLAFVIGRITGHHIVNANVFNFLNLINVFGWGIGSFFLNKKAAAEITKLDDTRCVGPLVDIWNPQAQMHYSRKTRRRAEAALLRLLPRLKASDAALLKEHQRVPLRTLLSTNGYRNWGRYYDTAFLIGILKAFEQIGDWKSHAAVRKLAVKAKQPEVRKAALECLPYLEELAGKQKIGETLMRASSAAETSTTAPETLLRPAAPAADAQPETLLRPTK